jgi:hypothetical protein
MATGTAYGTNYTIAANVTPLTALEACKFQGKVRVIADTITLSGAHDAGSLLYVGKLPKGSIPLFSQFASDTTNAVTGTAGWSGDADALGTLSTLANSLTTAQPVTAVPTVPNTLLTEDKDVYVTTAAAALEDGAVVHSRLYYALE